jgi:YD repeat-containing protein
MSLIIAGATFENHHYDQRGDVLYLSVAHYDGPPAKALSTPEGHNIEYDAAGRVVAITLTNVSWLLDRDGEITITLPACYISSEDLAQALRPGAMISIESGILVAQGSVPPAIPRDFAPQPRRRSASRSRQNA